MFSDKYQAIFIAGHEVPMFSNKYQAIFIADSLETDAPKVENRRT